MSYIRNYRELNELPEELEKWGKKALSQIESPEKAHEAAKELKEKMKQLWEECPARDKEEKVRYVLKKLGKAEDVAEELRKNYKIISNKKTDKIAGVIFLILSAFCSIYPIMIFFYHQNRVSEIGEIYRDYRMGVGAGSGAACAIIFLILGIWMIWNSRKEGK